MAANDTAAEPIIRITGRTGAAWRYARCDGIRLTVCGGRCVVERSGTRSCRRRSTIALRTAG